MMGRSFVLVNERAPRCRLLPLPVALGRGVLALRPRSARRARLTQRLVRALGSRGLLRLVEPRAARRDRLRLPDDDRGARPSAARRAGSTSRSSRRSPTSRRCTTGRPRASTCTSSRIPSRSTRCAAIAGDDTDVHAVHGLHAAGVLAARATAPRRARALGLPAEGKVVLVSGGGWGVGDLEGAIDAALALADVDAWSRACAAATTSCIRGSRARFAGEPRVRVEGFTEQMSDWLAAADALVHSTGGLTVLEALRARLPGDLLRLGARAHPREQRRVPPLRPRRGRRGRGRARARRSRGALASRPRSPGWRSARCRRRRRSCSRS